MKIIKGHVPPNIKQEGVMQVFDPKEHWPSYADMLRATLCISEDGTPPKVMPMEEVERLGMAAIMEVAKHLANDATAGIANGCIAKVFMDAGIILKP